MGIYVGFDPGGIHSFGWAVLAGDSVPLRIVDIGVADHAEGAFSAVVRCAGAEIDAVGIDAPLFWNASGDRSADQSVRSAIRLRGCATSSGTVSSVNALRGACLIQGILVAMMCLKTKVNRPLITEAHPKALLWLLGEATRERRPDEILLSDLDKYLVGNKVQVYKDHERDAALGAVAAFAARTQLSGWQDLYPLEPVPITPLDTPPGYWLPL